MAAGAMPWLGACGGQGGEPAPIPQAAELRQACPRLAAKVVEGSRIGLPSGPASIHDAKLVAATGDLPEYCQLLGSIAARTAGADPIRFQVNLPISWNEKALMYGGGGFNGTLITGTAPLRDAAAGQPRPLALGYATFGTDSGHDAATYGTTDPGKFALNDEMFDNFAHAAYKKVKDVAEVLVQDYYGRQPKLSYFFGGSEGGREGLMFAQRYPEEFNGIVAVVPVIGWTEACPIPSFATSSRSSLAAR
jgi:feruloyl esterase